MKKSKKIILSVSALAVILLIVSLAMLRKDMSALLAEKGLVYDTIQVDDFQHLNFSDLWDVKIKQGRITKVEIALEDSAQLIPILENRDGTLFFRFDTTDVSEVRKRVTVRITTRSLKSIRAVESTTVRMENFNVDTLNVILDNGGSFSGKNNQLNYVSIVTSGESRMEIIETMN